MNEEQTRVFWVPTQAAPEFVTRDLVVYSDGEGLKAARPMGTIRMDKVNFADDDQAGTEMNR